jgi:hypothetical protein
VFDRKWKYCITAVTVVPAAAAVGYGVSSKVYDKVCSDKKVFGSKCT